MDEMQAEALLVGLSAAVLSFAVPGLCLWLLLRWKPTTRPLFALRAALVPLALMTYTLGGPLAHMLLGTSSVLGMERLGTRLMGIIGLWVLSGPIGFAVGWFTARGRLARPADAAPLPNTEATATPPSDGPPVALLHVASAGSAPVIAPRREASARSRAPWHSLGWPATLAIAYGMVVTLLLGVAVRGQSSHTESLAPAPDPASAPAAKLVQADLTQQSVEQGVQLGNRFRIYGVQIGDRLLDTASRSPEWKLKLSPIPHLFLNANESHGAVMATPSDSLAPDPRVDEIYIRGFSEKPASIASLLELVWGPGLIGGANPNERMWLDRQRHTEARLRDLSKTKSGGWQVVITRAKNLDGSNQ